MSSRQTDKKKEEERPKRYVKERTTRSSRPKSSKQSKKEENSDRPKSDKPKSDKPRSDRSKTRKEHKSRKKDKNSDRPARSGRPTHPSSRSKRRETERKVVLPSFSSSSSSDIYESPLDALADADANQPEQILQKYMFIYEANTVFYSKLDSIDKVDGRLVTIHPLYYEGYNNNLISEEIVYNEERGKYISKSTDGSWLEVIYDYPPESIEYFEEKDGIVAYEGKYFHCDGDLLYYLTGGVDLETISLI